MVLSGVHKYLKAFGFPIEDFGNDGGDGFLSVSIRNLYNGRGHALSFPIEGQRGKSKNMDA